MSKREKTMVHVLKIDSNDLPERLDEVAAIFQKAWDDTPAQYRADMSFYKWGNTYYDSPYVTFEAYYLRDETDDEMAARLNLRKAEQALIERTERETLARLQARYGRS